MQALASGSMCGLIWFVQLVHYPLFSHLEGEQAQKYSLDNQRRTPLVVIPLMLMEMVAALCLAAWPPVSIGRGMAIVGVGLILVVSLPFLLFAFTTTLLNHIALEPKA